MHCKDISVRDVGWKLTRGNIRANMEDWRAYKRAEYVVLRNGEDMAVVRLRKSPEGSLLREVTGFDIISLPEDTVFVDRPDTDVVNLPAMARIQSEHPGKTVVVRGLFSHIGFVSGVEPLRLRIIDAVPPRPSKLPYLVDLALRSGYVDLPVVPYEEDIDMSALSEQAGTREVMFPCQVSGASSSRPFCFLDQVPDITGKDITLVGCNLSRRIFREEYGFDAPFIDICPRDRVPGDGVPTIVKCCRVKSGFEIDGSTVSVPWGATVPEVAEAIKALFGSASAPL
ncbi:MAG: hypothetical protein LKJ94_01320 [Candidatus Methanomethylophilus sp.]|nr:hypothetical protein [Methanomethylophilus sp.]MCI2074340.1 hypothetical protein [Methanomethylophilus sp.]MCI2092863.1 hypothetical protein [Methanomethylophilus sp.]